MFCLSHTRHDFGPSFEIALGSSRPHRCLHETETASHLQLSPGFV